MQVKLSLVMGLLLVLPIVPAVAQITTSLHEAVLADNLDVVRHHIEAGSDLNQKDPWGSTPLVIAATFGRTAVAKALIEAGADLHIRNNEGATPLHAAAFFCRTEIVETLLEAGANKYLRDNFRTSPREAVAVPFDRVKGIYDTFEQALGPLGLQLDYEHLKVTRPKIADMLRPRPEELEGVEYAPLPADDWKVSTPAEQALDPMLLAELYLDASGLTTLYGLLVIKNGHMIAEGYFNEGAVDQLSARQSVTKSYTSALVGVALDQGHLSGVDQKMMDFFPEVADRINDPRKEEITIRHLLQMRAGFPWEERMPSYMDSLFFADNWHWIPHIVGFPLTSDPGTEFGYSNLTSHLLAVIVARAVDQDLKSFAQENLFSPIGAEVGKWSRDADDYRFGAFEMYVTARDMAKFGLLYLNGGEFEGKRVLSAKWVEESLESYSSGITFDGVSTKGRYFRDIGYGYQWWSATAGEHRFDYAAGHGGNLIVLLHDLDMIVVTTADPLYELPTDDGWAYEGAIIDVVGKFIASLPTGTPE